MEFILQLSRSYVSVLRGYMKYFRKIAGRLMLLFSLAGLMACATPKELRTDGIPAVPALDLERYQGRWYEIMRLPNSFEEGLESVTATYTLEEDGEINVINRGYDTEEGGWSEAEGSAWLPDPEQPGLLRVSFFWIFASDYKVIALDQENYTYAMVTSSSKEYLWILSRTKQMDPEILAGLIDKAKAYGFTVGKLIKVRHE